MCRLLFFVCTALAVFSSVNCVGKYSEEANVMSELRTNNRPFRMQKLNLIWDKARKRLSDEKVKLLNTELKIQDKEELTWKRLKADGQDKDGLVEAELRRKLKGILHRYDLMEHFPEVDKGAKISRDDVNDVMEKHAPQAIFKDKKLNRMWEKAERSGFSDEELKTLKEEFQHHQEKIEDYYNFMEQIPSYDEIDNSVESFNVNVSKDYSHSNQALKEKHTDLKRSYERLGKIATAGPDSKNFEEHKVVELWKLAQKADFTEDELNSLKEELRHYEHRVRKLTHMQAQVELAEASNKWSESNVEDKKRMEQKIKQYSHKVDKIHVEIEGRIMQRHLEL